MRLKSFSSVKLHGYLDLNVQFDKSLTFLTGRNGSGKTSVVRGTIAMLSPSFRLLGNLDFQRLEVVFSHDETDVSVEAQNMGEQISLSCSATTEVLDLDIFQHDPVEPPSRRLEAEAEFYSEQQRRNANHEVLVFLRSLPTPMFLDLERRSQFPRRRRGPTRPIRNRNIFAGTIDESLEVAEYLVEGAFRQDQAAIKEITDALRQDIILTAFFVDPQPSQSIKAPGDTNIETMERNKGIVVRTLRSLDIPFEQIDSAVGTFFSHLRETYENLRTKTLANLPDLSEEEQKEAINAFTAWMAIQPQDAQINRIVKLVEEYRERLAPIEEHMTRYLSSVNGFLVDSDKELSFTKSGDLRVIAPDGQDRPITALSSGERQIVVILTHLAFNEQAKLANVLMIDEPELSLHVHWQELFVQSILSVNAELQLILATHSPTIIADHLDACVDLGETH